MTLIVVAFVLFRNNESKEPPKQNEASYREIVESSEEGDRQPGGTDQVDIQERSRPNVRNWGEAETLAETVLPVSWNPYLSIRRRIVRDAGFQQPVLLEENVILDPANNQELVEVRDSMIANQLLISSERPLDRDFIEDVLDGSDWTVGKILGSGHTAVLLSADLDIETVASGTRDLGERFAEIEDLQVEPNTIVYAAETIPNDAHFDEAGLWGLNSSGDNDIDAPEGWDQLRDASEVAVAIVDSGIRLDHEDLAGNLWQNSGEISDNNIDDDNNGYVDDVFGVNTVDSTLSPDDDSGHGTHVAGIVGAVGNNDTGVVGVAWTAKLMAIKFLNASGRGDLDDAVEAIDYAVANGAKIINASWGIEGKSSSLERAMERASDSGVFIVAAAGNESSNIDRTFFHPASSDLPNVITVASTDESGNLSPFSNYGIRRTDLAAARKQHSLYLGGCGRRLFRQQRNFHGGTLCIGNIGVEYCLEAGQ